MRLQAQVLHTSPCPLSRPPIVSRRPTLWLSRGKLFSNSNRASTTSFESTGTGTQYEPAGLVLEAHTLLLIPARSCLSASIETL
jgi:hypothetical protein